MGFDPSFERPTCLATLKSSDRTKQSVCGWQYIYIYIYHYQVVQRAWISLTLFLSPLSLSHHPSLSSTAPGRSSKLHPLAGWTTLVRSCVGIRRKTSLMNSSLLLQQWPAWLIHLNWVICEMGRKWPYSCCFMGCCFQDLFRIGRSILQIKLFLCAFC